MLREHEQLIGVGSSPDFAGADAHIYRERYYPHSFVVENTVGPEDRADWPEMIIFVGPGRSGSTAFLALLMSHPRIDRGYYQPWKTLVRHGLAYGKFVIPGRSEGVNAVVAKETLGPFSREAEEIDPVDLTVQAGIPLEKCKLGVLLREPLAIYASNLRFEGGIAPEMLISNIQFSWQLYEKYAELIPTIPIAYEVAGMDGMAAMRNLFSWLGLPFHGLEFDAAAIRTVEEGGKFVPGEAAHPAEHQEIIAPTFHRGTFEAAERRVLTPQSMAARYRDRPGAPRDPRQLVRNAEQIQEACGDLYEQFYALSWSMWNHDSARAWE